VFIASSITGLTFEQIIPELIPFVLALLVCILLLVFIPEIALLIPSLVAG
jgi:C4-dicarboxylate transporter DctM subunit